MKIQSRSSSTPQIEELIDFTMTDFDVDYSHGRPEVKMTLFVSLEDMQPALKNAKTMAQLHNALTSKIKITK